MAATHRAEDGDLLVALATDIAAFEVFYRRHVARPRSVYSD